MWSALAFRWKKKGRATRQADHEQTPSPFGAALAIVMLGHWARQAQLGMLANNPWLISASAFLFGLLCALFITGIARWRGASPETLIMAGIIISALIGSATSLLHYLSADVELAAIVSWMFGDLGKATPQNVRIMALALLYETPLTRLTKDGSTWFQAWGTG